MGGMFFVIFFIHASFFCVKFVAYEYRFRPESVPYGSMGWCRV